MIESAIKNAVAEERKRCVESVRAYGDGIQAVMDDGGGSPELLASLQTVSDIADMLEGKQ
jgi:hypothetical protein